jgi:hypothetical protein
MAARPLTGSKCFTFVGGVSATEHDGARATPRYDWRATPGAAIDAVLLLVVAYGVLLRVVGLPIYRAESGDEWGNTILPLRMLYEQGNPRSFIHPSLYYSLTAAADAALFGLLKLAGVVDASSTMSDVLLADHRYFTFAARWVSLLCALLTLWAAYRLGRSLWQRRGGLAAAALLAVLPLHVHLFQDGPGGS